MATADSLPPPTILGPEFSGERSRGRGDRRGGRGSRTRKNYDRPDPNLPEGTRAPPQIRLQPRIAELASNVPIPTNPEGNGPPSERPSAVLSRADIDTPGQGRRGGWGRRGRGGRGGRAVAIVRHAENSDGETTQRSAHPQLEKLSEVSRVQATSAEAGTSGQGKRGAHVRGGRGGRGGAVAERAEVSTENTDGENSRINSRHDHLVGRARGGRAAGGGGVELPAGDTSGESSGTGRAKSHTPRRVGGNSLRTNSGRPFGGHLTTTNETQPAGPALQADAPEFHPGQPLRERHRHAQRPRGPPPPHRGGQPGPRRESIQKSNAEDISTQIHEDISNGVYECAICTNDIGRKTKIWSCRECWRVFHLGCVTEWSQNEVSTLTQPRNTDGDFPPPRQWRCPGCNLAQDNLPSEYHCWCTKEVDPLSISGLSPHSCGQTCGRPRSLPKKCPHPCELVCHAGPCPPCSHLGPVQSCFCGKKSFSRKCVDTNYDTGWSCGEVCGDVMPCGEHICQKPCHEGLCGTCEVIVESRCYCGKVKQPLACFERGDEKPSRQARFGDDGSKTVEDWIGSFECQNICQRSFDCGKHSCETKCHPQELEPPHCLRSPDIVSHCPCGKTPLTKILRQPRESCEDPIPNCEKKCLKKLSCNHLCQQVCHSDPCLPCLEVVDIACRCGRVTTRTTCHQGKEAQPQCLRVCKAMLNCGRHECGDRCCPGERKAAERQAARRKHRPLGSRINDDTVEAEHICTRVCGRQLKCGNHTCPDRCHKGPCASCREAIFDEISCHCGRTTLVPPLPCGALPPPCQFQCERPKACGHPQVAHNCHGDEESCPKCPFLGEKACMCGKKNLRNQPCWLADVRCGEICGKKLRCGSHFCQKQCHRLGGCEDAVRHCRQPCGKAKKMCGHPCEETCHAPSSCREDKACQNKIFITCDCQHLKQEMKCNASRTSEGNSKKNLPCDDECARLARNRQLALALNIDPNAHKDDHIPYSHETLRMFRENMKWAQQREKEFRVFAADEKERRLRFKPMPQHQRAFIHSLSEDFCFDGISMDPEPYRHVAVFKTPKFVMAPMKTLLECLRIRNAATAISELPKKFQTSNTPYNGFLLAHPRFGVTVDEIWADYSPIVGAITGVVFDISFLLTEEIVIRAQPTSSSTMTISATSVEASVRGLKTSLTAMTLSKQIAKSVQLCSVDSSMKVTRREVDDPVSNGGWSQVAAKASAPRSAVQRPTAVGEKGSYTVLGSRLKDAKEKKKRDELEKARQALEVVDDWEEELGPDEATGEDPAKVEDSDLDQPQHVTSGEPSVVGGNTST